MFHRQKRPDQTEEGRQEGRQDLCRDGLGDDDHVFKITFRLLLWLGWICVLFLCCVTLLDGMRDTFLHEGFQPGQ